MPEIRLRDYCARVAELNGLRQYNEAIAHCQHILGHYPDHLRSVGLLAQAYLGSGMQLEAIDTFERTLAIDPENVAYHLGLAEAYAQQGLVTEAIRQLGWAYELAPGQGRIRDMLQRLNAQRPGSKQANLRLSRGALGALYARSGLWEKAADEFRALLVQDTHRPHTEVALGEALWRLGKRAESVETCLHVLQTNPRCLKANLILGEIWMRSGHQEAARDRLDVAQALDPESLIAHEMLGQDSPLPVLTVLIPELGSSVEAARPPAAIAEAPPPSILPDWFRELQDEEGTVTTSAEGAPVGEDVHSTAISLEQEATRQGHPDRGAEAQLEPEPGYLEEIPEWLQALDAGLTEVDVLSGDEVPEWLARLAPAQPTVDTPPARPKVLSDSTDALPPIASAERDAEALPEWLDADLPQEDEEAASWPTITETTATLPDDEPVPSGLPVLGAAERPEGELPEEDDRPEWVREMEAVADLRLGRPLGEPLPPAMTVPERAGDASPTRSDRTPSDPARRLELAVAQEEAGDFDGALDHLAVLVAGGQAIDEVIRRLEGLLDSEADEASVCRLLGDAYRIDGGLDRALEMYRQAQKALKSHQTEDA